MTAASRAGLATGEARRTYTAAPAAAATTAGAAAPTAGNSNPGVLTVGGVALGSSSMFAVRLDGTTAGTQYDQLADTGSVSWSGATLSVSLGFSPAVGQTFTIINNGGGSAVSGTFAGLPEGTVFTAGGVPLRISYGGSGHDVTLTVAAPPSASISAPSSGGRYLVASA